MKSENIKLGKELNFKIWERGIKKPPHHILVNVTKTTAGVVEAELAGFDYHSKPVEPKTKNTKKETKNDVKKTETAKEKIIEEKEKEIKEEQELVKEGALKPTEKQKQGFSKEEDVIIKKRKSMARDEKPSHEVKLTKK